ncbi:MAG: serine/threonine-protein phosphatase [Prevotella sp.]|nr:serine/threonine-protein phosphatase [Prevotella sp.]
MQIEISEPLSVLEMGARSNQEDSLSPCESPSSRDRLFILCDGMGGHEHGEVASRLVCEVLSTYIGTHWSHGTLTDDVLKDALAEVFRRIKAYDNGSSRQMGTTLVLLCLHEGGATMAHIGDSRIYHIRPSRRQILYKSRDHSLAYDLFLAGEITEEEMRSYSKKNVITRAITPAQEKPSKADIVHTKDIQSGDIFYLCSDGMLERMGDKELVALFSANCSLERKRQRLVERTQGNQDNHSSWIIQIKKVIHAKERCWWQRIMDFL